jgi:hypothetical protein
MTLNKTADVGIYDTQGRHQRSADPEMGRMTKNPEPGRITKPVYQARTQIAEINQVILRIICGE